MRERFEQRLFRIFAQAGYSPVQLLTVTPEEMVEIPGITVPNIRAVLCVQNKVLADRNKVRSGRLVEELLKEAEESRCRMWRNACSKQDIKPLYSVNGICMRNLQVLIITMSCPDRAVIMTRCL